MADPNPNDGQRAYSVVLDLQALLRDLLASRSYLADELDTARRHWEMWKTVSAESDRRMVEHASARVALEAELDTANRSRSALAAQLAETQREIAEATKALDDVAPLPDGESKPLGQRVADEMADFFVVMDHCSLAYDYITGGIVSKPMTLWPQVETLGDDRLMKEVQEQVEEETQDVRDELTSAQAEIARLREGMRWIPVTEAMPEAGRTVLAFFVNEFGHARRIRAEYAAPHTLQLADDDGDFGVEAPDGEFYCPEGWYEQNEYEETHWAVSGSVTHWMPLPSAPDLLAASPVSDASPRQEGE